MKRCNNCGTINEMGVVICVQCNMPDNFTPMVGGKVETVEVVQETIICVNCGTSTPSEGTKCISCHFPLPANLIKKNTGFQNLKVG